MKDQDHYRVLGITPDADQASIRAAYRAQMKRHHPDLNPDREDADSIAASINLAYEVLGRPGQPQQVRPGEASDDSELSRIRLPFGVTGTTIPGQAARPRLTRAKARGSSRRVTGLSRKAAPGTHRLQQR